MMEKHGEIRKGLTPPEAPEEQALSLPEAAEELLKEAEDRFKRLEEHMTTRAHTRITENLR